MVSAEPRWSAFLKPSFLGGALGIGSAIVIVLTNVVVPTIPEGDYEPPVALSLLLLYFATAGFVAARRTQKVGAGVAGGAVTALIGVGIALLAFVVVDNVFLDIVSKQADKIYGFHHSHFHSMRAYINDGLRRFFLPGLMVFTLLGTICGAIGGGVALPSALRDAMHKCT